MTTRAQAARELLESMGGLWIKAGQLLSLRTDVLSREMADELSSLTYQAQGFAPELARAVVETALGKPLEAVFDYWEEMPFVAASISQVHRARLRANGRWVAVKVQRPGIQEVFLHPGNIMLLRDSGIALIDLGSVGNLEQRFVRGFRNTYRGFSDGNFAEGVDYHLGMLDSIPVIDTAAYRSEMVERLRAWEARSHLDGLTAYERLFTGGASMALSEVMLKYRTANNWQMLRLVRSLNTMDANINALLGAADPQRIWRKYFEQSQRRALQQLRTQGPRLAGSEEGNKRRTSDIMFWVGRNLLSSNDPSSP